MGLSGPAFGQATNSSSKATVSGPSSYPVAHPPTNAVWPWEGSDLSPDPGFVSGVLPNGLRYIIRVNKLPVEAVSIRMSIDAGSRHETDDQRGYAHLLEHMAFNGSQNIP
jgi:zinc protease